MRLQLPKNADPENPHKYWVFEGCCFYKVAAEQKARTTYENLLRLADDPDVREPLKFLRAREIAHFQRFGETEQSIWNDYSGVTDKPLEIKGIKYFHFVINGQPRPHIKKAGLFNCNFTYCQ